MIRLEQDTRTQDNEIKSSFHKRLLQFHEFQCANVFFRKNATPMNQHNNPEAKECFI